MDSNRKTTVMFAGLSGDAAAQDAIARALERIGAAAASCGGRVAKATGDRAMILIAAPDAAADAAVAIHTALNDIPAIATGKLGLGIGFHHGPVIQKAAEVFGDTVNLASRLGEKAAKGQIITTRETAALLSPLFRPWVRKLGNIEIKGRSDPVELCELVWRADDNATMVARKRPEQVQGMKKIKLKYRGSEVERRRGDDAVIIGRDPDSGLVVDDDQVSRHHCTIERRGDNFVIADTSSNGTYVTIQGEEEVLLEREELTLRKRGWIAFGQPRAASKVAVEFISYT